MRDCQEIINNKKKCSGCGLFKELGEYRKQASSKSGYKSKCKECLKVDDKKYTSVEKNRANAARWRKENKDRLKAYDKKYRSAPENTERIKKRQQIGANARYRLFKHEEYMNAICMLFDEGMSLNNYGEWELDHIVPVAHWLDMGIEDFDIINAIENLQPLWKSDNAKKSNNY